MDGGKASHAAGVAADTIVATGGFVAFSISFLDWLDLVVKVAVGLATLVLILLRIRAHLVGKPIDIDRGPIL